MARERDDLLTVDDLIADLHVSQRTFYRWRELGRAPKSFRLPNGDLRCWRSDYLAWLHSLEEGRG